MIQNGNVKHVNQLVQPVTVVIVPVVPSVMITNTCILILV
jgi:hypothetical protein